MKFTLMCGMAVLATASFANFVSNGSFELGNYAGGGFVTLNAGNTDLTGWTIANNGIDWVDASFWQPSQGTKSLDLSALSSGKISQSLSLTAGQSYKLTFDFSGNNNPGGSKAANVKIANLNAFAFYNTNIEGNSYSNMKWKQFTATFTATGNDVLSFTSLNNNAAGIALDNVRVESVPEPASIAALSIGAVALLRRRKKA